MLEVTDAEIKHRLEFDNPWWEPDGGILPHIDEAPRRAYFEPFLKLVNETSVRRAVVLMGPRRVGKTWMLFHTVKQLLDQGVPAANILYASLDNPVYSRIPLQKFVDMYLDIHGHPRRPQGLYVLFDEIQYLKDWEQHLKVLVDSYPGIRFIASGSAAAALKRKSEESGAGRFTDFTLPPLTFPEYLGFRGEKVEVLQQNIESLNIHFVDYALYGGFPEAVMNEAIRSDFQRFVGNDLIDKVLLRDLPSVYGIDDSQELNRFFAYLSYNTGQELSLDGLSKHSGIAKNTIKKYLDYLEAAFLIYRLHRVDQNARRLQRVTRFKVYLSNPSLRTALYGVPEREEAMGAVMETAFMVQMFTSAPYEQIAYASWPQGEVDLVMLRSDGTVGVCAEVQWSDRYQPTPYLMSRLAKVSASGSNVWPLLLTRSRSAEILIEDLPVTLMPLARFAAAASEFARFQIARNITPCNNLPFLPPAPPYRGQGD